MRPYAALVPVFLIATAGLSAQEAPRWRFGLTAAAPAQVLEVNSTEVPDSNSTTVGIRFAAGAEVARVVRRSARGGAELFARLSLAPTRAEMGSTSWSPGAALIADIGGRLRAQVADPVGLFAGVGISHWRGPDDTAPFSDLGPILLGAEAGFTLGRGALRFDISANATRFGAIDERSIAAGFVWRLMVGVHNER